MGVNNFQTCTLVVVPIPLLCAAFHLCSIVGCQGQVLGMTASRTGSRSDEILEGESVEGPLGTPTRLDGVVDIFRRQVSTIRIVPSAASVLLVEDGLVLFEALHIGVVDILGKGHKRRRRSVGSRHFMWRTGRWFKGQQLTLLLSAHDRHALLWSSLPLPQSSSVYQLDKPQIFSIHSILMSFGVWTIFIFHPTHPCSIFVSPLSSNPFLSPITPLDLPQ